jgi:uncharacterized protein involved in type VI secretion and phage assembly
MTTIVETIQKVVKSEMRKVRTLELGVVQSIFPHGESSDKNNYECNITLPDEDLEIRKAPIATQGIGLVNIPQVGDLVLVAFESGDINHPIVIGRLYNAKDRPPISKDEEIIFSPPYSKKSDRQRLRIELAEKKMVLTLTDELLTVEAGKTVLKMKSDGEVTVESESDIKLQAKGDMTLAAANIKMKSDEAVQIEAGTTADIKSSATMTLKGATINLN